MQIQSVWGLYQPISTLCPIFLQILDLALMLSDTAWAQCFKVHILTMWWPSNIDLPMLYRTKGAISLKTVPLELSFFKGLFSDSSNIFLWHESEDITNKQTNKKQTTTTKKPLFPQVQLIPILCELCCISLLHRLCVEFVVVDESLCVNCSHFTLKWFQLNSFREMCFLEENYQQMKKNGNHESILYMKLLTKSLTH